MSLTWFLSRDVPHDNRKAVKDLWEDRDWEYGQAKMFLQDALQDSPGRPMVVAGLARVGKSHLMTRLIHDLQNPPESTVHPTIHVAHRLRLYPGTPRKILVDALHDTLIQTEKALESYGASRTELSEIRAYIRRFSQLFNSPGSTASISGHELRQLREKTSSEARIDGTATAGMGLSVKGGGGEITEIFGLPAASIGFQGSAALSGGLREGDEEETTKAATQVDTFHIPPIEEEHLIALIHQVHRQARRVVPGWTTVLAFDDFDLLYRAENKNFDPKPLLRAMSDLAKDPGLFVLATVRKDTLDENQSSLYELTTLEPFTDPEILLRIYRNHVRFYWNRGEPPLQESLVLDVAARCEGRIGIFLDFLRAVLKTNPSFSSAEHYLQRNWASLQLAASERAILIKSTLDRGETTIKGEEASQLLVGVSNPWVYEDYTSNDRVTIHPVLASLLREGKLK